jgi:serine phosphatase RsbU (regulator of sigma subunit)
MMGVLYLDSRKLRSQLTEIDKDLLHLIATEAATLVENTTLAKLEEEGRRYREELKIASEIQQSLMRVRIPELNFARVRASSLPCKDIGGDFYDAISADELLYIVVADVSGKGVSAALLGSTLQGIIYAQVLARQPLAQIALFANRYICHKKLGKYATLVVLRLSSDGDVEYINCGHVRPLLHSLGGVESLPNSNFPVGLLEGASYESDTLTMKPGERILIVTDGITEAETHAGDPYGDQRLRTLLMTGAEIPAVLAEVESFTGNTPREDDCTIVEVCYSVAWPDRRE